MKFASLSFSKNAFVATEARLLVGRRAMTLSTSSVTGVSRVNKGIVIPAPPWRLLPRSLEPEYISTRLLAKNRHFTNYGRAAMRRNHLFISITLRAAIQ